MPVLETPALPKIQLPGLHLYHFGMSNCSQRVRILLEEKRLAWTGHPIDLSRDEHATPQYLAINPRGLVPALVHDGRVVIESLDIMEYLEINFPATSFRPATDHVGVADEVCTLAAQVQPALKLLSHEFLFKPVRRMSAKQLEAFARNHSDPHLVAFMRDFSSREGFQRARISGSVIEMDRAFARLEQILGTRQWLAGERFSIADIAWMPNLRRMELMRFPLAARPALRGWLERIKVRPSYRRALAGYEPAWLRYGMGTYTFLRALRGTGVTAFAEARP
ncbi:MAG: glutathione S-transferase family protein [Burkholderiales bacterium]